MMWLVLSLLWLGAIFWAIHLYYARLFSRFDKCGVKYVKTFTSLGDGYRFLTQKEHGTVSFEKAYNFFPEERFWGRYDFNKAVIIIKDLELLKQITVKDFEHFLNHRQIVSEEVDPLLARNLFFLKDQEWKDMRSTMSPAFTSSKMRHMLPFMVETADQMVAYLKTSVKDAGGDHIDVDVRDLITRYSSDIIASCTFGLKMNTYIDRDNQFYRMGNAVSSFKFAQMFKFMLYLASPRLANYFSISLWGNETKFFFENLVKNTMEEREAKHIIRPDMIHLLMEAKKGNLIHDDHTAEVEADAGYATVQESVVGKKVSTRVWSESDFAAQAVGFFLAGFETVSSVISFLLHELAVNPDVQEKLIKEIDEHWQTCNGNIDYTSIMRMTYMDMVVSELLRLWPPLITIEHECNRDYNLGRVNRTAPTDYTIRKGEIAIIPVWPIHRDPEHFPKPTQFDPERFSDENKHRIKPFTYMPFGLGPRNCIGSRFALCEVKVLVYKLLLHMQLSPCEKTCIPSQLDTSNLNLRLMGGHWVRMKPRLTD